MGRTLRSSAAVAAAGMLAMSWCTGAFAAAPVCAKSEIRLVNSMREISQPYHANLDKGGRLFAAWAGLQHRYVLQLNQGDSDKQLSLMRAVLSSAARCTVFNVEPNADLIVKPMVETANRTGGWIVTHWAHQPGFRPFDGNDQWIAHVAVNSFDAGVSISRNLVGALGGMATGGILGMFVGATLLALGYQIFMAWVAASPAPRTAVPTRDSTSTV